MRVELAKPGLLSVDGALHILALVLTASGLYLVAVGASLAQTEMAWGLVVVGLILLAPRYLLSLQLTERAVKVRVGSGQRTFEQASLGQARIVDGNLAIRLFGVGAPGYHTGFFYLTDHGRVRGYASRFSGPFVLIEREEATDLLLSPEDPEAFLDAYRAHRTEP